MYTELRLGYRQAVGSYIRIARYLCMLIRVVMFGYIIAGSLCSIVGLPVLSCVAACCKISVADCQLLK